MRLKTQAFPGNQSCGVSCLRLNQPRASLSARATIASQLYNADKGCDSQQFPYHIETMEPVAVIPSKSNRKQQRSHDKTLYRRRNRIERRTHHGLARME